MFATWSQRAVWVSAICFGVSLFYNCFIFVSHRFAKDHEDIIHDFGNVFWGETKVHVFELQNTGRAAVTISRVVIECGCTTIGEELKDKTVGPNERMAIPVRMRIGNLEGKFAKKVVVQFAGKSHSPLILTVSGNASPRISWFPAQLDFDLSSVDQKRSQVIHVKLKPGASPLAITGVSTNTPTLQVELQKPNRGEEEGREWIIKVTTADPLPVGRLDAFIFVHTSDPAIEPISVKAVIIVRELDGRKAKGDGTARGI
jgi:hypothetical protein